MSAHTHSSSSLLAPQAVSHPSIHVTERWVQPVTGQLVAVTLIYVAPLSSLFLLWWRDHVCSLPIRKVYSAHNGRPGWELSQTGVGRRAPAWVYCMMASCLDSITSHHCFCSSVIQTWMQTFSLTSLWCLMLFVLIKRQGTVKMYRHVCRHSDQVRTVWSIQGSLGLHWNVR